MRRYGWILGLAVAAGSVTGCGQMSGSPAASAKGGIAVVDLDKVAAETGRDRQLAQSLELAQNSLNENYSKIFEKAKDELTSKKKGLGEQPSDEQKKELSDWERSATTQLGQLQNQARVKFEQYKQTQIARFRSELKPIAQEIAAKRGLSIVIPKNEGLLLSVDPGVDITDEVVKVLREKHPVVTPAPETPATTQKQNAPRKNAAPAKSAAASRTAAAEDEEDEPFQK
jgi:Skp family chaperone for outer membrane proteins